MKKSLLLLSSGLLTLGVVSGCKNSSAPVDLKFKFEPGTKFQYVMDIKQTIQQMGMTANQDMTMESTYDVAAGDGNNKKLTVNYDRIYMKMSAAGMNMEYDSRDASKQNDNLKIMGGMVNKPFTMTVTPTGEITSVNGLSEILNGMVDSTDPNAAALREQLKSSFNDSSLRATMQQAMNIYPDTKVQPGDTWKKNLNMSMGPIAMSLDNTFKLVNVNNGIAHIEVNSKVSGKGADNPALKGVKIDLNGDQKGTMDVDVASGMITDSKLTQTIKGKLSMDNPNGGQPMEMPMDLKSDTHITGKKK